MMDGVEYEICNTQGNLYEFIAKKGFDIERFSGLYLQSDFCRRAFDTIYSRFQLADELECMDFIVPELKGKFPEFDDGCITEDYDRIPENAKPQGALLAMGPKDPLHKPESCFSPDAAYWIGFTYRQLYIETGTSSRELSERLPFDAMCRYYPGLHTVDEEMAVSIICEDYGFVRNPEHEEPADED